jgi:hypothetical protein
LDVNDPLLRLPRPAEAGAQSMRRAAGMQVISALTPQSFDRRRWVGHAINEMRLESLRPAISFHAAFGPPASAAFRGRRSSQQAASKSSNDIVLVSTKNT